MPTTTPDIKVKAVRRLGGTVELVGDSYTETQTHAQVPGSPGCSNPSDPMPSMDAGIVRAKTPRNSWARPAAFITCTAADL